MITQSQIDALWKRMRGMSAADLSVLQASSQTPESNMTTAPGSPNEALWSEFVAVGWMTKKEDSIEIPGREPFAMTIYSITPEGLQPIRDLLAAALRG